MTTVNSFRNGHKQLTFEDFEGLRAEGYVRDSTLDQRDGYGPALQRSAIMAFARNYGLVLGSAWYTDFITGTSTVKRSGFRQALGDAQTDCFDVLLVHHTSRFARNRADAIRYKAELRKLGITVIFVSQGIISGNDRDFLNESINEVLDEHYSRNLSRWVAGGLWIKHQSGIANGVPPLGYRSEKLDNGKRERKVPDNKSMVTLLKMLECYASGQYSYQTLADLLNASGFRNRKGEPFTKGSVEQVMSNRFYEGKVVYHPGEADEHVTSGAHEVPQIVKDLWSKCQAMKQQRAFSQRGRPRSQGRSYPFSRIAKCQDCGMPYGGQAVIRSPSRTIRRLHHRRPFCQLRPHSVRVERLMAQFEEGVLPYVALDESWRAKVIRVVTADSRGSDSEAQQTRVKGALDNLRKQHLWQDINDETYRKERTELARQLQAMGPEPPHEAVQNLERAAQLLIDLPALWTHPGVDDRQREELIKELFTQVDLRGKDIVAITPKQEYQPLFASLLKGGVGRGEWTPTTVRHPLRCHQKLASSVLISGSNGWRRWRHDHLPSRGSIPRNGVSERPSRFLP